MLNKLTCKIFGHRPVLCIYRISFATYIPSSEPIKEGGVWEIASLKVEKELIGTSDRRPRCDKVLL